MDIPEGRRGMIIIPFPPPGGARIASHPVGSTSSAQGVLPARSLFITILALILSQIIIKLPSNNLRILGFRLHF